MSIDSTMAMNNIKSDQCNLATAMVDLCTMFTKDDAIQKKESNCRARKAAKNKDGKPPSKARKAEKNKGEEPPFKRKKPNQTK